MTKFICNKRNQCKITLCQHRRPHNRGIYYSGSVEEGNYKEYDSCKDTECAFLNIVKECVEVKNEKKIVKP